MSRASAPVEDRDLATSDMECRGVLTTHGFASPCPRSASPHRRWLRRRSQGLLIWWADFPSLSLSSKQEWKGTRERSNEGSVATLGDARSDHPRPTPALYCSWLRRRAAPFVSFTFSCSARSTIALRFCVDTLWATSAQYFLPARGGQQLLVAAQKRKHPSGPTHRLCMSSMFRSLTLWTTNLRKPLESMCFVFLFEP
jgi:hypothetical protein